MAGLAHSKQQWVRVETEELLASEQMLLEHLLHTRLFSWGTKSFMDSGLCTGI